MILSKIPLSVGDLDEHSTCLKLIIYFLLVINISNLKMNYKLYFFTIKNYIKICSFRISLKIKVRPSI